MDDPTEDQVRQAQMIVLGAIAATGSMNSSVAWKSAINQRIPEVAALMGPRSYQMRRALMMLDAAVFTAVFIEAELEQTSTRMLVSLEHPVDRDHQDGRQVIRTERTDTATGKRMADRLHDVKAGQTLLCYKVHEEMRGGDNAGRPVSILMHMEVLPDRNTGGGRETRASGQPSSVPAPSPDGDAAMQQFSEATKDWNGKAVAALVGDLRAGQLWPPTDDNIAAILEEAKKWAF